jgi:anti-sigma factor RsiW
MDCEKVQEEILESFEASSVAIQWEIDAHLAGCPRCAKFGARQKALDARLSMMLIPPEMSPAFRTALHKRIRRETTRLWSDSLPDIVHFVSCGVATLLCAVLLPFDAAMILGSGAAVTVLTYILLTAVRGSFENAEDPGR